MIGRKNETELLTDAIGTDEFEHLPATSASALQVASNGSRMLSEAIPKGELKNYPGQAVMVSAAEKRKFMVEHTIATDPHWVLDRAEDGTLTPDMLGTLKKYYPQMHTDISNQIREQAGNVTTYQQRLLISSLIGEPTSTETEPAVRAILGAAQSGVAPPQQQTGGLSRPHSSRSLQGHKLSSSSGSLTSAQKTAFDTKE